MNTLLTAMIGGVPYALSPRRQVKNMSLETYHLLAYTLCLCYPTTPIHCHLDRALTPNSLPLDYSAMFFEYIVVDSKHFFASQTSGWNKSSLVHVLISGPNPKDTYGEILEILQIDQDFRRAGHPLWLAHVRWFIPWYGQQSQIWDDL